MKKGHPRGCPFSYAILRQPSTRNLFNFAERHAGRSLRIDFGGGGNSTPALGTLIGVAKTEAVASAYAATYPIALIAVVFVSQFLVILF